MKPVLVEIAGYAVTSWAFGLVLAAAVAGFGAWRTRPGLLSTSQFLDLSLLAAIGAGVGSRLAALASTGPLGAAALLGALALWRPALISSFGAAAGALLVVTLFCLRQRLPVVAVMNHLLPFGVLGAGIHRVVGCFMTGCCAGLPTGLLWGVRFPGSAAAVHPTQLYLGAACIGIFMMSRRVSRYPEVRATTVALAFALVSFAVGTLRPHAGESSVGALPLSQAAHLAIAAGALSTWIAIRLRLIAATVPGKEA